MDWLSRIPDLANVPTKFWVLTSIVTGAVLMLPDSLLAKLQLDVIPSPYGAVVGVLFLVSTGFVLVNGMLCLWHLARTKQRKTARQDALIDTLFALDPAEQAVLREFYIVSGQSTLELPLNDPVVAGLVSCGILQQVGSVAQGSRHGIMTAFRVRSEVEALVTPEVLGVSHFVKNDTDGTLDLTDKGIDWIKKNRPRFIAIRRLL